MLEFLKPLSKQKYDCVTFFQSDKKGQIRVEGQLYQNPGEKMAGNSIGDMWHIILYRDSEVDESKYADLDYFDAIVGDPLEYISTLIPHGFYGLVARKTTTSNEFINRCLDIIKQAL